MSLRGYFGDKRSIDIDEKYFCMEALFQSKITAMGALLQEDLADELYRASESFISSRMFTLLRTTQLNYNSV